GTAAFGTLAIPEAPIQRTNFASNRPYSLTAHSPSNPSVSYPAADKAEWPDDGTKLTDGIYDPSGTWNSGKKWVGWRSNEKETEVVAEFDLGEEKAVNRITADFVKEISSSIDITKSVKIEASLDTGATKEWYTIHNRAVSDQGGTAKTQKISINTSKTVKARYIRLTFAHNSVLMGMDEIEIQGVNDMTGAVNPKDIEVLAQSNILKDHSYNMVMGPTFSSFLNEDTGKKEITDGKYGTVTGDMGYQDAPWVGWIGGDFVTFDFDLGAKARVDEIVTHIYPYPHYGIEMANNYKVEVSDNARNWTTLCDGNTFGTEWLSCKPDKPIFTRFVRVTVNFAGYMMLIDEIEVLGAGGKPEEPDPDPDTVLNLALGRPYYLYAKNPANPSATLPSADQAAWPDNGEKLTDGITDPTGDWNANKAKWVSWQNDSGELLTSMEIDLGSAKAI
ncbi:MAG: discoidin domain-containing protein, partial [Oscillospiraceae bacterium]